MPSRERPARSTRPIGSRSPRSHSSTRSISVSWWTRPPGNARSIPMNAPGSSRPSDAKPAPADETPPRRRRPQGPPEGSDRPAPSDEIRSPDGKWTAFVKDHNVFVRAEGKPEAIALSTTARRAWDTGGSPGRPTRRPWSPSGSSRATARRSTWSSRRPPAAAGPSSRRGPTPCPATSSRPTS